jgi:hypothetical protein
MSKLLASFLILLFLGGCSGGTKPKYDLYPNQQELVGVYYWGDGYGANEILKLHADDTYEQTLLAHLDSENVVLRGRWQLKDKHIYFYKPDGTYPARPDRMTNAETFFYKGKPAFVREQDLRDGKVGESWVYRWQHGPDA